MQLILETPKRPAMRTSPQGRRLAGAAWFTVRAFDPTESVPEIYDYAQSVTAWLSSYPTSQPFRVAAPSTLSGQLVDAVVPRALLEALPGETRVAMQWEFVPGEKP